MWPFRKHTKPEPVAQPPAKAFPLASVSTICIEKRLPVMHAVRLEMSQEWHSGWVLNSGRESTAFSKDVRNYRPVPLELMIENDATLALLRDLPVGTELARYYVTKDWRFITRDKVGKIVKGRNDET
jgi:hypothetical protein